MVTANITFLLSIFALAAEIPLAQSHCLPPFPNNTISSNTTHQDLRPSKAPLPVTLSETESNDPDIDGIYMKTSERLSASVCGASSYTSSTTATSPLVLDCRQLAEKIRRDKHYTTVYGYGDNHTIFPILTYGSCMFGVRPAWTEDVHTWQYGWYIGNKDIWQIASRVADEFEIDGRSSGNGLTHCVVNKYVSPGIDVHWAVFSREQWKAVGWKLAPPIPSAGDKNMVSISIAMFAAFSWTFVLW